MMALTAILLILILSLALAAGLFWYYYNNFIKLKHQAAESLSGIDVQLKRRYDLIPNIVESVKGYAAHERGTLDDVVKARSAAMGASGIKEKAEAENILSGALKSLFALAENYPDLKANQNFMQLQSTLSELEDQIQLARRYYNAVVRDFNIMCEAFPSVIIANMFGFIKMQFLEFGPEEKQNVQVKF